MVKPAEPVIQEMDMQRMDNRFGRLTFVALMLLLCLVAQAGAQVSNIKVVTDASPDYSDMDSMIHSVTSKWSTHAEKCWAMYYWNHIARRQTSPMTLHGKALTDPIRQFNDYGYMMCSTIAGSNCAIWHNMGMDVRFWDISLHTVSECFYDGRWHIYDNSMSALYTLCDGVTVAGVEDVGKEGACAASGGKVEPGHIAKYHCLNATSNNGFLTGADCPRDLAQEYRCFKPSGLKHRYYYHNWDWGHRYILNLRERETYTRYYRSLGKGPEYFVPNKGKDPESVNERYRIRANGVWTFKPRFTPEEFKRSIVQASNIRILAAGGLQPAAPDTPAEVVFKVNSANVTTSQKIRAEFSRNSASDLAQISISTNNGLTWQDVWTAGDETGDVPADVDLMEEVNGAYEILVKVTLEASRSVDYALLNNLKIETTTMLNGKTQPQLRLGKNTVHVGQGDQTDSIVLWPELQGAGYKPNVVEERNIATRAEHPGYLGVMHAAEPREEAYVVYRIDAPQDIKRVKYGGRFYNRAPDANIRLSHSFDNGQTWTETYQLTDTEPPWDVIRYETVDAVPADTRSVLMKYSLNAREAGSNACSIYSVRMEVNHQPVAPGTRPLEVRFAWSEVQADRSLVERSHTQRIDKMPAEYTINVGGVDHPIVDSLQINLAGAVPDVRYGYSDGKDVGGEQFVDRWVTYGPNLLEGKPYTVSVPPTGQWGGDDPDNVKLTDGIVGPPYAGGIAPRSGAIWGTKSGEPEITVDMGRPETIGAFRIHLTAGWPWWDALRGEVQDEVEVLSSLDGETYQSHGKFDLNLWRKDIPINHFITDEETARAWNYERILEATVSARYVKYKITPRRAVCVTEVQALKFIKHKPFDIRIALPGE